MEFRKAKIFGRVLLFGQYKTMEDMQLKFSREMDLHMKEDPELVLLVNLKRDFRKTHKNEVRIEADHLSQSCQSMGAMPFSSRR